MFTRKHYVTIAAILKGSGLDEYSREVVGNELADVFESDNPKFDRGKFCKAANIVSTKSLGSSSPDKDPTPPKQELVNPANVVDVPEPDPSFIDDRPFDLGEIPPPPEPLANWKEALSAIEYDPTLVEGGYSYEPGEAAIREAIQTAVLQIAEDFTVQAGYAAVFKTEVYSALMAHIREKFLNGASLGLAERQDLLFAWNMLPQTKERTSAVPGLIAGIIEYGNQ